MKALYIFLGLGTIYIIFQSFIANSAIKTEKQKYRTVVKDEELEATSWAKALELAGGPTYAFGTAKKMFKSMNQPSLEAFLDTEAWAQGLSLLTDDHKEGFSAFLEKRKPHFKGC